MSEIHDILMRTAVVIPAYNASEHLGPVLEELQRLVPRLRIVVVDDGSRDETYRVASGSGVQVIQHPVNLGKGAALSTGYEKALQMGMEFVVTLDADGQHNPAEIPVLAEQMLRTGADIVVGNRLDAPGAMPALRLFTNRLTSAVVSALARQRIPDSQNGFRMIRTRVLEAVALHMARYEAESEILIKAGKAGFKIASASVETIYGEETSSIHPLVDTLRFFRLVIKALFW